MASAEVAETQRHCDHSFKLTTKRIDTYTAVRETMCVSSVIHSLGEQFCGGTVAHVNTNDVNEAYF